MTRLFRWLFLPRFIAVRYKIVNKSEAYKNTHNQLADELGMERMF